MQPWGGRDARYVHIRLSSFYFLTHESRLYWSNIPRAQKSFIIQPLCTNLSRGAVSCLSSARHSSAGFMSLLILLHWQKQVKTVQKTICYLLWLLLSLLSVKPGAETRLQITHHNAQSVCLSVSCSHAVWPAADPPGHHSTDDQQLSEGQ